MKTLDEVIDAMERCSIPHYFDCKGCPYEDDDAEVGCRSDDRDADALHYLKEYRKLDSLDAVAFPEDDNPAMTWDELRTMEGKPVWIEVLSGKDWDKEWMLLMGFPDDNHVRFKMGCKEDYRFIGRKQYLGKDWQAYRKEKHESTDRH